MFAELLWMKIGTLGHAKVILLLIIILISFSGSRLLTSWRKKSFSHSSIAPIRDLPLEILTLMLGQSGTLSMKGILSCSSPSLTPRTLASTTSVLGKWHKLDSQNQQLYFAGSCRDRKELIDCEELLVRWRQWNPLLRTNWGQPKWRDRLQYLIEAHVQELCSPITQ